MSRSAKESGGVIDEHAAFTGARLLRVIAAPATEFLDLPSLLGAELYGDGVAVRWLEAAPEPGGMAEPRVRVTDNLGTEFRMFRGGALGIGLHVRCEAVLVPAVPREATVLYVELASRARLSLALD